MTVDELYDRLEDDNQHTLAAMLVAVASEDTDAVVELGEIAKRHFATPGGISEEDSRRRREITKPLFDELRERGVVL